MSERNRTVTVVFTDLEDTQVRPEGCVREGFIGLGRPEDFADWITAHLEGVRDIVVLGVKIEDTKTTTTKYELGRTT